MDDELKPQQNDGEDEDDYWDRLSEWERRMRQENLVKPEPEEFKETNEAPKLNLKEKFGGRLQVIVKLANIELTPEKSRYEGGTWHVEGKMVSTCSHCTCTFEISDMVALERGHLCNSNLLPLFLQHHTFLPRISPAIRS